MEADFSGYATKTNLKCADGRVILPDAFAHQDKVQVPLVWQHGHTDPENVLGHVQLENRSDGVYVYAFFNPSPKAQHAKTLVEHKDIKALSIWANELIESAKRVSHGVIREVSLVISGANPGALIDNITIRHSADDLETLDNEAIITTGLEIEIQHSDTVTDDTETDDKSLLDVLNTLNEEQQVAVSYVVGEAFEAAKAELGSDSNTDTNDDTAAHSGIDDSNDVNDDNTAEHGATNKEGNEMSQSHNVFEGDGSKPGADKHVLSHDAITGIVEDAKRRGSLRGAVESYALAHGITDIDVMFPDAKTVTDSPEFLSRRMEWVAKVLGAATKTPFARIKTVSADITEDEARAKGYVTGEFKKEEFFSMTHRVTTPQTVYKKQKLDRDDIIDINDFDVVSWLKAEMRLMLDEEIARAILISDGRDISHEDKIQEANIRPIAKDHELYTTEVFVNLDDSSSTIQELIDAIVFNRRKYKGSGLPTFFTSETIIARFLLLKDAMGRRIYKSLDEVASELRVAEIVPVEAMEEEAEIVGVLVNMSDYSIGTDRGGEVNMFDDFDIDYNQLKYLMETRLSGALTRLKSAIVIKKVAAAKVLIVPAAPAFDDAHSVTITNQTGVVYKNAAGDVINAAGSPYTVVDGTPYVVTAEPTGNYYFATSDDDTWTFTFVE